MVVFFYPKKNAVQKHLSAKSASPRGDFQNSARHESFHSRMSGRPRVPGKGQCHSPSERRVFWENIHIFFSFLSKIHNIKFTILAIFEVPFSCVKYIYIVVQQTSGTFSSCETETLYSLNMNSPLPSPKPLATTFLHLWSGRLQILYRSGTIQYLSFCDGLISLSMMSSRFKAY